MPPQSPEAAPRMPPRRLPHRTVSTYAPPWQAHNPASPTILTILYPTASSGSLDALAQSPWLDCKAGRCGKANNGPTLTAERALSLNFQSSRCAATAISPRILLFLDPVLAKPGSQFHGKAAKSFRSVNSGKNVTLGRHQNGLTPHQLGRAGAISYRGQAQSKGRQEERRQTRVGQWEPQHFVAAAHEQGVGRGFAVQSAGLGRGTRDAANHALLPRHILPNWPPRLGSSSVLSHDLASHPTASSRHLPYATSFHATPHLTFSPPFAFLSGPSPRSIRSPVSCCLCVGRTSCAHPSALQQPQLESHASISHAFSLATCTTHALLAAREASRTRASHHPYNRINVFLSSPHPSPIPSSGLLPLLFPLLLIHTSHPSKHFDSQPS